MLLKTVPWEVQPPPLTRGAENGFFWLASQDRYPRLLHRDGISLSTLSATSVGLAPFVASRYFTAIVVFSWDTASSPTLETLRIGAGDGIRLDTETSGSTSLNICRWTFNGVANLTNIVIAVPSVVPQRAAVAVLSVTPTTGSSWAGVIDDDYSSFTTTSLQSAVDTTSIITPTDFNVQVASGGSSRVFSVIVLPRTVSDAEARKIVRNPWSLFQPRRIWVPVSPAGGSFTSTGALSATAATVAGSATHLTLHTSTGSLVSGSSTVAGVANSPHLSTGALTSQAATLAGTATHLTLHTSSGALAAQDAAISGAATTGQVATGALSAQAAVVAGSATHLTLHTSSGALAAGSAIIVGSALHPHTSTGALAAGSATVAGAATLVSGSFDAVGSLSAQAAAVVGAATRFALHTCTGALVSDSATVSGSALHTSASGVYTYMWLRTA